MKAVDGEVGVADARRALEAERARYAELFDSAPIGFALTDRNGVVRDVNAAASDLLGVDPKFLIGKPLVAFVPPDERREFRTQLLDAIDEPGTHRWETTMVSRHGVAVIVEITVGVAGPGLPLEDLSWVIRDISERAIADEAIRRFASELETRVLERTAELEDQRALLEAVIENIPSGLLVVDAQMRPILVNEEALRLFDLAPEEKEDAFSAWAGFELVRLDGTPVPAEARPIRRTLDHGEVVTAEVYETLVSGRHVLFEVSSAPVTSPYGDRVGALALVRDVTTRQRTERAERDFVTNAAHELQSPLTAIVSAIEVLQAGAKDGPERDVFLGHIEQAADRLARLARALLILARSQVGVEAPRDELVAVRALLEEVAEGLRVVKGVGLEIECPADLAMLTNRELVEQAVMSLAENAAKRTRKGKVVLSAQADPDRVVELAVSDTGPGIAATERSNVFQRFYRADPDGTGGFGLGLAIVRAVVDALEGELDLDSEVGVGTTFKLRIPGAARFVQQ